MVTVGGGFAVVIANDSADKAAIAALESRDIAVKSEIFAVFVMAAVADTMADIVEESASFELNASLRGQMVKGL